MHQPVIAQLEERLTVDQLVVSSNLTRRIQSHLANKKKSPHGPMDKAPAYGAGDSRFES